MTRGSSREKRPRSTLGTRNLGKYLGRVCARAAPKLMFAFPFLHKFDKSSCCLSFGGACWWPRHPSLRILVTGRRLFLASLSLNYALRERQQGYTQRERESKADSRSLSPELHLPACTCIFTRDVNMHHRSIGVRLSLFLCLLQMLLCDMGQRWIVFSPGNPSSCTYVVAVLCGLSCARTGMRDRGGAIT